MQYWCIKLASTCTPRYRSYFLYYLVLLSWRMTLWTFIDLALVALQCFVQANVVCVSKTVLSHCSGSSRGFPVVCTKYSNMCGNLITQITHTHARTHTHSLYTLAIKTGVQKMDIISHFVISHFMCFLEEMRTYLLYRVWCCPLPKNFKRR